mmetsp:Transcript_8511/g.24412  ORF Transcript_8511/g.24412 Transcript_8511/m.24412 type:complete len:321 (-) Transcript_8511:118-1080(-)
MPFSERRASRARGTGFSPQLLGISAGAIRRPDTSQSHKLTMSEAQLQTLLDSQREAVEQDAARRWELRLELTVSAVADELREENDRLKQENQATLRELDRARGMWTGLVDCMMSHLGSAVPGSQSKPGAPCTECSVCFSTPAEAALKGDRLNVFYCGNGCPNILCETCMDAPSFTRHCLFCRTSAAPLQGRARWRPCSSPCFNHDPSQDLPPNIDSSSFPYTPTAPAFQPTSPAYWPTSPAYAPSSLPSSPPADTYTPPSLTYRPSQRLNTAISPRPHRPSWPFYRPRPTRVVLPTSTSHSVEILPPTDPATEAISTQPQ